MVNIGLMIAGILGVIVGIFLIAPSGALGTVLGAMFLLLRSRRICNGFVEVISPEKMIAAVPDPELVNPEASSATLMNAF